MKLKVHTKKLKETFNCIKLVYTTLMQTLVVIAHNIRSTHNIGSLLRTAEGLGVSTVYITGYSPYPLSAHDTRLPHITHKLDSAIHKTALGAETLQKWEQNDDIYKVLSKLHREGYTICALEQSATAHDISTFKAPDKCALLLGSEVTGVAEELLSHVDHTLVIPMFGQKESFNVVQAAAMALYQLRFH